MAVGKRVIYRGRVQGVGFRDTTQQLARGYAVHGFVRNLADGTVELVAEGESAEVDAFLAAVARRMADAIEDRSATDQAAQGFQGFNIRH